jgi:hypothetical protein
MSDNIDPVTNKPTNADAQEGVLVPNPTTTELLVDEHPWVSSLF